MIRGKLSVVIPAYNESKAIESNLLETVETLSDMSYDFEIIVVDDGSLDNTHMEAVKVCSHHPERVRVVRYDRNLGKGNALTCGARYASGDYVVFLDADMDLHPRQLPLFFELLDTQNVDAVIGSKRHPLSNVNYPRHRRLYSTLYYFCIRLLFGLPIRDTQTGLKVFKTVLLQDVLPRLVVKRFAFDLELLAVAHRLRYRVGEAPVTLHFRREFGRLNWNDIRRMLVDTAAIFYRMKVRRYYDHVPTVSLSSIGDDDARVVEYAQPI